MTNLRRASRSYTVNTNRCSARQRKCESCHPNKAITSSMTTTHRRAICQVSTTWRRQFSTLTTPRTTISWCRSCWVRHLHSSIYQCCRSKDSLTSRTRDTKTSDHTITETRTDCNRLRVRPTWPVSDRSFASAPLFLDQVTPI